MARALGRRPLGSWAVGCWAAPRWARRLGCRSRWLWVTGGLSAALAVGDGRSWQAGCYPTLRVLISHGGGSVPYQIGRWQAEVLHPGLGGRPDAERFETALRRFWFDTVLHYPPALELLFKTVGPDRVLFGTEKPGSGSAPNPDTGRDFDDLKPVIVGFDFLTEADRRAVFEDNARLVFPGLKAVGGRS